MSEPEPRGVTLAILAGGEGRRMGMPKGELIVQGQPILRFLHARLAWPGPTLLVTAPGRQNPPGSELFDAEVVDPVFGLGPLRGALTALEHASTAVVVITPLDMPWVDSRTLSALAGQVSAFAAQAGVMMLRPVGQLTRIEPLPAAFARNRALEVLRGCLARGELSLMRLAEQGHVATTAALGELSGEFWTNLNYPQDLASIVERQS